MASDRAQILPAQPPPVENALQLPFDFHRIAGAEPRFSSYAFQIPATPEAHLAAAFGVQLFRYNVQPSIVLNASRMTAAGEARASGSFSLATSLDSTCGD